MSDVRENERTHEGIVVLNYRFPWLSVLYYFTALLLPVGMVELFAYFQKVDQASDSAAGGRAVEVLFGFWYLALTVYSTYLRAMSKQFPVCLNVDRLLFSPSEKVQERKWWPIEMAYARLLPMPSVVLQSGERRIVIPITTRDFHRIAPVIKSERWRSSRLVISLLGCRIFRSIIRIVAVLFPFMYFLVIVNFS